MKTKMNRIVCLWTLSFLYVLNPAFSQSPVANLPDTLARNIRKTVYKDIQWGLIDERWNASQKSKYPRNLQLSKWYDGVQWLFQNLSFPGWGDFPGGALELEIQSSALTYPLKNWRLYEVIVPYSEHNTQWFRWHNYYSYGSDTLYTKRGSLYFSLYLSPYKKWLLAVSPTGEIKKLSGFFFSEDCMADFKCSARRPRSFLPYLRIRYYTSFDSLWYVGSQRDTAFFEVRQGQSLYTLAWDMRNSIGKKRFVSQDKTLPVSDWYSASQEIRAMPPVFFQNTQEKEAYLKDMLMRNLYLYRIYQQGLFKLGEFNERGLLSVPYPYPSSVIDQALPDYDEKIGHIAMYRFPNCPDGFPDMDYGLYTRMNHGPSFDTLGRGRFMVSGYYGASGCHLYALLKTRDEVLIRAFEGFSDSLQWRVDSFYFPEASGVTEPPVPIVMDSRWQGGACPESSDGTYVQLLTQKLDRLPPVALYWLALDENSKEVYFISGEDIFLSPAVRLYLDGFSPYGTRLGRTSRQRGRSMFDNDRFSYKLHYIADRLFQYGVFEILKSEVVQENWTKTVVETQSHYPVKGRRLRATFYEDRPEEIEVEWLDN